MREVAFIKQNKEKWLEFEQAIFGKLKKNPDDLASLYIHLVNDLSYAQTYFPKSKTVVYLNHLASQTYQKIYKTKREDTNKLIYFFKTEVPLLVYQYKRYVLYAFLIFGILTAIGAISAKNDDSFVRLILGDAYVNMSLENIKDGNPVAVYKSGSNWGSFIGITFNNLRVGALSYFFGIFLGFGTFYILLNNCIMLGSFQYFFYKEGVFWESVRGIWIHGSMEIFAMVIEAAAGFALGASILFPNTYSRFNSFKIGFKNTFKIFLSTMPFTIIAGFLEGFITRYSIDMPHYLSVFIILSTLSAIGYYYLVYPFIVHKKINHKNVSII
jgi:uncharacterized membrane protein SpoIIM required for sporulation